MVLDIVFDEYQAAEITEANIKKLHRKLMKNMDQWSDSIHYDPGRYKILENVTVRPSGKIHKYTPPEDVPLAMQQLVKEVNSQLKISKVNNTDNHPLVIASSFHFKFLNEIHPFGDGNDRIARIFMNLILLKNDFPPLFISTVDKLDYMNCFEQEDRNPGVMLDFLADRLMESQKTKLSYLKRTSK
ncbi:Fic/DOC family protein [Pedobacter hartonius]|uniref:Fic/DOC family protein n=2 Tax=Pedobacter hartonius TaxID=425514 RepID=A0A1H4GSN8_9SPHI|nr:Fic/DOC family protein [Pedobacter hartonius]